MSDQADYTEAVLLSWFEHLGFAIVSDKPRNIDAVLAIMRDEYPKDITTEEERKGFDFLTTMMEGGIELARDRYALRHGKVTKH